MSCEQELLQINWRIQRWPRHDFETKDSQFWKGDSQPTAVHTQQVLQMPHVQNPTGVCLPYLILTQTLPSQTMTSWIFHLLSPQTLFITIPDSPPSLTGLHGENSSKLFQLSKLGSNYSHPSGHHAGHGPCCQSQAIQEPPHEFSCFQTWTVVGS